MKFLVEITEGWNGETVIHSHIIAPSVQAARGFASEWIKRHAPDPKHIAPVWSETFIGKSSPKCTVVDYGSWTYFGRFTVLPDGAAAVKPPAKRNRQMTKKKPYSRIENGKLLRSLAFEIKRSLKELVKVNAPEWYVRLAEEYNHEITKVLKLRDFLWVRDTEDSEAHLSDEAQQVCPKALKLLIKQEKAMTAFCKVLDERIDLGWPTDPANLPCKEAKKAPAKKAPAKKGK